MFAEKEASLIFYCYFKMLVCLVICCRLALIPYNLKYLGRESLSFNFNVPLKILFYRDRFWFNFYRSNMIVFDESGYYFHL